MVVLITGGFVIAILTVSFQSLKAATGNPVNPSGVNRRP